jgi:hypothetical protein
VPGLRKRDIRVEMSGLELSRLRHIGFLTFEGDALDEGRRMQHQETPVAGTDSSHRQYRTTRSGAVLAIRDSTCTTARTAGTDR